MALSARGKTPQPREIKSTFSRGVTLATQARTLALWKESEEQGQERGHEGGGPGRMADTEAFP